ncbi:hypothetical protein FRACYDRAFT_269570 [Fragilariopsis cylindrus CCMP1102]|uniref:RING-type domain-containing protein n=1 Tax=Fragilariopsis cylindrus CCMP1102 TaxID=635003 RepID=A0A1E7F841_9STRA|nr:hypothetical protein FRACYDRAFT_269570 [Fragilariopsis cylindrus CCMP1102]|eukprot:OEU14362.1 hypothetical protein FRACYDRAFT_269570 [Fragilariopsis cylindrus CCMP1102]
MDRTNKSCSHHDGDDDDDDDQAENDDDDEEPTCTICFCPFEEGDKIGDLICRHEFHVECLKGWAQRKNACPLCNVRLGRPERPSPITNASTRTSLQSPTIQSSLSLSLASSLSTSLALSSLREQTSRTTTANNNNNNDSNNIDSTSSTPSSTTTTTGGGGGGGLMQRISGLGRRNGSNNNNNNSNNNNGNTSNTGTGTGTGEIQMSNRVGIIASFSAADDTNTAYSNRR